MIDMAICFVDQWLPDDSNHNDGYCYMDENDMMVKQDKIIDNGYKIYDEMKHQISCSDFFGRRGLSYICLKQICIHHDETMKNSPINKHLVLCKIIFKKGSLPCKYNLKND